MLAFNEYFWGNWPAGGGGGSPAAPPYEDSMQSLRAVLNQLVHLILLIAFLVPALHRS